MVPHGNSSKRLPAGGSFLSGLRREDTGIQSRPNDPDRERKHAKTEVYYPCYDTGWEPHSWGRVQNGGSFLYNALAVYACGGGASVSDLMERPTPLPPIKLERCIRGYPSTATRQSGPGPGKELESQSAWPFLPAYPCSRLVPGLWSLAAGQTLLMLRL